ncbi:MAG: PEGA domain-containing protein [Deltaproteobacteria bacterium]|nr:PEGA domain-containing protein [Deltaproteobacteria bacterium]
MKKVVFLLCILLTTTLFAQTGGHIKKRIFVVTTSTDSFSIKAASIYHYHAKRILQSSKDYQLIEAELALENGNITPNKKLCAEANTYYTTGKKQFENMDLEAAEKSMSKALNNFWKCPAYIGSGAEYLETLKMMGAIYVLNGDEKMGRNMFRSALIFNPETTINKDLFPPNVVDVFEKVRLDISAAKKGYLSVSTIPQGAEVFINGVFAGISPISRKEVIAGNHFVSIEKDGYLNDGGRVDVKANDEEMFQAQLIPTKRYADYSQILALLQTDVGLDPIGESIKSLAAITGAEIIFANIVRRDGTEIVVEAYLFDIASKSRLYNTIKRFSYPIKDPESELTPFVLEFLSGKALSKDIQPVSSLQSPIKPVEREIPECRMDADCRNGFICGKDGKCVAKEDKEKKKFYKQWWFYSAVGGAVVLITGSTLLLWPSSDTATREGIINFKF